MKQMLLGVSENGQHTTQYTQYSYCFPNCAVGQDGRGKVEIEGPPSYHFGSSAISPPLHMGWPHWIKAANKKKCILCWHIQHHVALPDLPHLLEISIKARLFLSTCYLEPFRYCKRYVRVVCY